MKELHWIHSSAQSTMEKIKSSVAPFYLRISMISLNTISLHIYLTVDDAEQIVANKLLTFSMSFLMQVLRLCALLCFFYLCELLYVNNYIEEIICNTGRRWGKCHIFKKEIAYVCVFAILHRG